VNGVAVRPYNLLELCAGVGGLGLGVHIAVPGARGVAYVEREAYAAATLVARMAAGDLAEAPVWSDLATFDARGWRGIVDCVTSGDPCQPNSVAGKRGGADDDRFLIDQVLRIVASAGLIVSSAKTSRGTPTGNSPPSSDHWKQWVTALRQESSARPKLAPPIGANDCSSWPTWTNLDCAETGSSAWLQRARGWLLTLSTAQPETQGQLL
jgi:hypothetical protein